jgi:hypothetical protein
MPSLDSTTAEFRQFRTDCGVTIGFLSGAMWVPISAIKDFERCEDSATYNERFRKSYIAKCREYADEYTPQDVLDRSKDAGDPAVRAGKPSPSPSHETTLAQLNEHIAKAEALYVKNVADAAARDWCYLETNEHDGAWQRILDLRRLRANCLDASGLKAIEDYKRQMWDAVVNPRSAAVDPEAITDELLQLLKFDPRKGGCYYRHSIPVPETEMSREHDGWKFTSSGIEARGVTKASQLVQLMKLAGIWKLSTEGDRLARELEAILNSTAPINIGPDHDGQQQPPG